MGQTLFAVCESPETDTSSVASATHDAKKMLPLSPNNLKLEALAVKIAWSFAVTVALLMVSTLLLVVADYAGSRSALR